VGWKADSAWLLARRHWQQAASDDARFAPRSTETQRHAHAVERRVMVGMARGCTRCHVRRLRHFAGVLGRQAKLDSRLRGNDVLTLAVMQRVAGRILGSLGGGAGQEETLKVLSWARNERDAWRDAKVRRAILRGENNIFLRLVIHRCRIDQAFVSFSLMRKYPGKRRYFEWYLNGQWRIVSY